PLGSRHCVPPRRASGLVFGGIEGLLLPPPVEAACYRICQEALSNATRHASPRKITVELALRHDRLVIRVADDGVGFDQEAHAVVDRKSTRLNSSHVAHS